MSDLSSEPKIEARIIILAAGMAAAYKTREIAALIGSAAGSLLASGDTVKLWAEIGNSLISSLALIAAGIWTYKRFIRGRIEVPKAEVKSRVEIRRYNSLLYWIHVEATVINTGQTIVPLLHGYCRIRQCLPPNADIAAHLGVDPEGLFDDSTKGLDDSFNSRAEVSWPEIVPRKEWNYASGRCNVEPGEAECFRCDFFISKEVKIVYVELYFKDESKIDVGWNRVSIVELPGASQLVNRHEGEYRERRKEDSASC